jgi:hypothetical protein
MEEDPVKNLAKEKVEYLAPDNPLIPEDDLRT